MGTQKIRNVILIVLLSLVMVSVVTALAATNIVPMTHLTDQTRAITAQEMAPPECDSIRSSLEDFFVCESGNCNSNGNKNELILGTSGNDTIDGGNGDDCIVGGGGDDSLYGNNGSDVLIGGPGSDYLSGDGRQKDTDVCIDDPSTTTYSECEVTP
jgi:RTX calcium-binding nonapeptide repeat (4 copies)